MSNSILYLMSKTDQPIYSSANVWISPSGVSMPVRSSPDESVSQQQSSFLHSTCQQTGSHVVPAQELITIQLSPSLTPLWLPQIQHFILLLEGGEGGAGSACGSVLYLVHTPQQDLKLSSDPRHNPEARALFTGESAFHLSAALKTVPAKSSWYYDSPSTTPGPPLPTLNQPGPCKNAEQRHNQGPPQMTLVLLTSESVSL